MSLRGENYLIEVEGKRAKARVWKRPDLDSAAGARDAAIMVATLADLAPKVHSLVFDLREAPLIAGPKTVDALSGLFRTYESAGDSRSSSPPSPCKRCSSDASCRATPRRRAD